jgi:hypothetical protein
MVAETRREIMDYYSFCFALPPFQSLRNIPQRTNLLLSLAENGHIKRT